jgi:hypothetical protein
LEIQKTWISVTAQGKYFQSGNDRSEYISGSRKTLFSTTASFRFLGTCALAVARTAEEGDSQAVRILEIFVLSEPDVSEYPLVVKDLLVPS